MGFFSFEDGNANESNSSLVSEINMTPFVDVCLVLLIIFMISAPLALSGINVNLPKGNAKTIKVTDKPFVLTITKKGEYFIKNEKVSSHQLQREFEKAVKNNSNLSVYIRGDSSVNYGKVMQAMSLANKAGIQKIGMVSEKKE